jgi:hypothetical protein
MEGLDAAIVVGGPTAVLVAADFALEAVHEEVDSSQFTVNGGRRKRLIDWETGESGFQHRGHREHRDHRGPQRRSVRVEAREEGRWIEAVG